MSYNNAPHYNTINAHNKKIGINCYVQKRITYLPEGIQQTLLLSQFVHKTQKQLCVHNRILKLQMIP